MAPLRNSSSSHASFGWYTAVFKVFEWSSTHSMPWLSDGTDTFWALATPHAVARPVDGAGAGIGPDSTPNPRVTSGLSRGSPQPQSAAETPATGFAPA